jgi:hypothetical protein
MRLVFIITNNPNLVPIDFAVQQLAGGVPQPGGQFGRLGLHNWQLAAHSLRALLYGGQAQTSRLLHKNVNQKMGDTEEIETFCLIDSYDVLYGPGLLKYLFCGRVVDHSSFDDVDALKAVSEPTNR